MRSHAREQTRFTEVYTSFSEIALSTRATFLIGARFRLSDRINLERRQVGRFKKTVRSSSETSKRSASPRVSRFFKRCPRFWLAVEPFVPFRILRRPARRRN